jgi:3-deoxy-manno-octulosonate cytidylyltransferase (CMP-KDO synthetase)
LIAAIIPARFSASRFPGKPLVKIAGITMIERVVKQTEQSALVDKVIVATDDKRVFDTVSAFGAESVLTRADHHSGTDRLAEVIRTLPDLDIIVNVQGDNPLIDPAAIDAAIQPLLDNATVDMSTIAWPIATQAEADNSQIVKVVVDQNGYALYFSRSAIPFYRDNRPFRERKYLGHMGLYVYRRQCLLKLAALPPSALEQAESLEQLRALVNGIKIKVIEFHSRSIAVDVPEDVEKIEAILQTDTYQPIEFTPGIGKIV